MRKWYRLYPTVLVLGAAVVLWGMPRLFGQAGGGAGGGAGIAPKQRVDFKGLALPAVLPVATGYTAVDAFAVNGGPGLTFVQPLSVVAPPGEKDRLFVVSKVGTIEMVTDLEGKNGGPKKSLFMDLVPYLQAKGWKLGQDIEWGLMGLAFHPDFAKNGYFYITYDFTTPENRRGTGFDRVARFSVRKDDPSKVDMESELPLITQLDPAANHNGGCILFGQDGYLYTSIGDGGAANDQYDNARWIDKDFFAAIFRLDVDRRPENLEPNKHAQVSTLFPSAVNMVEGKAAYKVPADNPFVGEGGSGIKEYFGRQLDPAKVRTEIYAAGLRNAWRYSIDEPTGRMFCAEIGQDRWEEVDIIVKGGNYGWSYRESLHDGPRIGTKPTSAKLLDPIYEYGHGNASGQFSGNSISGGFIYRGSKYAELTGAYIFGDYTSKKIWALREKEGKWTATVLASNIGTPVEFVPDPRNGDPLFCDIGAVGVSAQALQANGRVKRLVRTGVQGAAPPALLSQVGAFKDLQTLTPAEGVTAYAPNVTFWSDYAVKSRWFMVPKATDTIGFSATGNWTFPAGMVWVKHFEMEMTRGDASTRRRLETRFLMKTAGGVYGITYKWRADGSDADLVTEAGADEVLEIKDGGVTKQQTWHYPSQSECLACHTDVAGGVLGFNTWQLNGARDGAKGGENQIEMLARSGYFGWPTALPDVKTLGAYAKAEDTTASLEWRVRSYLGANCVQCHQPGGIVQGLWDARPTTPLADAGLIDGMLVANRGDKDAKVIVPGDAVHSMLLKRLEARDAPRMPQIGSNELDPDGRKLIREWIESLGAKKQVP